MEGYRRSKYRIYGLKHELEEWHTIATGITQKLSPVIVNTNEVNSRVEKCAIKCTEIERQIIDEIQQAEYNRECVRKAIESVRDERKREILTMHYVNNMSVKTIAVNMEKDVDNIYKIMRKTIKSMEIEREW